jgi:filamentous hemagglutinin
MKNGFSQERLPRSTRVNCWGVACLSGSILAATVNLAAAATKTWTAGDGVWSDPAHWVGGVPAAGDDAILSSPNTTTAYLGGPAGTLHDISVSATTPGTTLLIGGGTLTANRAFVGNNSLGAISQNSGTFTLTPGTPVTDGRLILGNTTGGVGTYSLSGGSILADILTVGGGSTSAGTFGTGTFTQSGGDVNLATVGNVGELVVGDVSGSIGTYNLTGGTLQAKNVYVAVSGTSAGERKIVQTGGVATISNTLQIGGFTGGSSATEGSYTLAGTSASQLKSANVYVGVSGIGTFTQDGGINSIELGAAGVDRNLLVGATFANSSGTYTLKSGTLSAEGEFIGNPGKGTFIQTGGTNNVSIQLWIDTGGTNATKGSYTISGGTLNTTGSGNRPGLLNTSEFTLNGGTVNVSGVGSDAGLDNRGTFTIAGGTLSGSATKINFGTMTGFGNISGTGALINRGTMNFTDGTTTISSPVTNDSGKTLQVTNSVAVFDGNVDNNGIIKTTAANVIFNGDYGGGGSFISDPSTNTFNNNFSLSGTGALVGGEGDIWRFGGNVTITTTNNLGWNTVLSEMDFFGTTGNHNLTYPGLDLGKTTLGYIDNFAWGIVNIPAGQKVLNTNDAALYTDQLVIGGGTGQIASFTGDLAIYYDPSDPVNSYLGGQTYSFGSGNGMVAPVPEPSSLFAAAFGAVAIGLRRRREYRPIRCKLDREHLFR